MTREKYQELCLKMVIQHDWMNDQLLVKNISPGDFFELMEIVHRHFAPKTIYKISDETNKAI